MIGAQNIDRIVQRLMDDSGAYLGGHEWECLRDARHFKQAVFSFLHVLLGVHNQVRMVRCIL